MVDKTEIKIRFLQRGVTQKSIADGLGITREAVCRVMAGKDRTPRVRAAIASALGWPARKIWDDSNVPPKKKSGPKPKGYYDHLDAPGRKPEPTAPEKVA